MRFQVLERFIASGSVYYSANCISLVERIGKSLSFRGQGNALFLLSLSLTIIINDIVIIIFVGYYYHYHYLGHLYFCYF